MVRELTRARVRAYVCLQGGLQDTYWFEGEELQFRYDSLTRLPRDHLAFVCALVARTTVHLHRGEHGRHLHDRSTEAGQRLLEDHLIDVTGVCSVRDCAGHVERVGGRAQHTGELVVFVSIGEQRQQFGAFADAWQERL
jgi:hypothetical protein